MTIVSFIHQFKEFIEKVRSIVRSGAAFRMVLHAEDPVPFTPYSLNRSVKEILVCYDKSGSRKCIFINRIRMVLACNIRSSRLEILNGMISAPVSELELICLCSACK